MRSIPRARLRQLGVIPPDTVYLQAMGEVPGKPAGDIRPGDLVGFNGAAYDEVARIEAASPAFVRVTYTSGWDQRFKRDRLVAIVRPERARLWTKQRDKPAA